MRSLAAIRFMQYSDLSNRHRATVDQARLVATTSFVTTGRIRHGAILLLKGCAVSYSSNVPKIQHQQLQFARDPRTHAEYSCIAKSSVKNLSGSTLVVVRLKNNDDFGCSMPCAACQAAITAAQIKRVVFSVDGEIFGEWDTRKVITETDQILVRKLAGMYSVSDELLERARNLYLLKNPTNLQMV